MPLEEDKSFFKCLVDYIVIDEFSMLGQTTFGWIDKRCRQATGFHDKLFGWKSVLLISDPAQLPPVGDKPLFHITFQMTSLNMVTMLTNSLTRL